MGRWDITGKKEMKKLFLMLVVLIGFLFAANAQVCKISGSNDNVEVFNCEVVANQVWVTVSNDSNDINANVTVTVNVSGLKKDGITGDSHTTTISGKGKSRANQTDIIKIDIPSPYSVCSKTSAKCTGISGSKCL